MEEPVIDAQGLTKVFGETVKAVDSVSFTVRKGEIFGFLGPNGAGKSTTINMLTTVMRPTAGRALVCGYDVAKHPMDVRRRVGVVPQEYTADEDMSGRDNIVLCADLYGIPRRESVPRVNELLQIVELQDAAGRKVGTYSGGMRRRLELACGLINYPSLLFLDEPTLGLDVQTRTAVWKYIRALKVEYGMTLFLTTHYLEEADSLCDRIAIIDHGHIVQIGTPAQLKANVGGDVVEVSVQESQPDLSTELQAIPMVSSAKQVGSGYRVKTESGDEVVPQIMDTIRAKGLHVTRISVTKPSLDEAYLELTGRSLREEESDRMSMMSQRITMRRARS